MSNYNPHVVPRTGLPPYQRDGLGQTLELRLADAANEFEVAVDTLADRLDDVADEFTAAFDAEDRRAATVARIQHHANPETERLHRERTQRIG